LQQAAFLSLWLFLHNRDWIFETKLDGYRAVAVIDSTGKARIWSRNRLPLEQKFPTVRDAAEELKLRSTILDGEIVALDEEGIPRFQLLQKWQKRPTAPVMYVLFDLLWDNGRDLTGKSVIHRRKRLQEIITSVAGIQVGGYLEKRGVELFQLAKEKGLESIIAKRKGSMYQPGRRSPDWLKIKSRPTARVRCLRIHRRQRAVANILAHCYSVHTKMGNCDTSVIRVPASVRKDWQTRSID